MPPEKPLQLSTGLLSLTNAVRDFHEFIHLKTNLRVWQALWDVD